MASIRYKLNRGGERPAVALRLKMDGSTRYQATVPGVHVFRDWWSNAKQTHNMKAVPPPFAPEVTDINRRLADLAAHIAQRVAQTPSEDIDRRWLAAEIDRHLHPEKYVKRETPATLLGVMEGLIDGAPTRIIPATGRPVTPGVVKAYGQTLTHVREFLRKTNRADIRLTDMDAAFYGDFVGYLYGVGLKPNTAGKHIKNIKTAINQLPLEKRVGVPFMEPRKCVRIKEEVENVYLTEDELQLLLDTAMPPHLARVRDDFLLLAWTGCRYSDLDKLTEDNVHDVGGYRCFRLEQQKTGNRVTIPVLPVVEPILARRKWEVISNQKFNDYIKEACKTAGIVETVTITESAMKRGRMQRVTTHHPKYELVTAHTARRSFATNMYKRGFPTLMIMAITGHKTEKAFLTYIKVTEDENAEMMMRRFMEQLKDGDQKVTTIRKDK